MNKYEVKCYYMGSPLSGVSATTLLVSSEDDMEIFQDSVVDVMERGGILYGNKTVVNTKYVHVVEIRQLSEEDQEHGDD